MFQLNKPANFKQNTTINNKPLWSVLPAKHPATQPLFAKKRVVTQLPVAMDTDSSTANPHKYVANSSQSERSVIADGKTSTSTPPAIFDINQLFKRTSSSSSSTFDVMSCKCVYNNYLCISIATHPENYSSFLVNYRLLWQSFKYIVYVSIMILKRIFGLVFVLILLVCICCCL